MFPAILDHPTAEEARRAIAAASVQLTGHPCLGQSDPIFLPLRRHARAAGWPRYADLDARIAAFQNWCDEQIIGQ